MDYRASFPDSSRKRVGFDARWYNDSGVGTYVSELVRAIGGMDRPFELIVYEDPKNPVPGLDDFPIVRIPMRSPKYSLSEQWEFGRRTRQDHLDLLHSPFYVMPVAAGCPVVVTVHDLIPFLFKTRRWAKQQAVKAAYRMAARRAQHFMAVSRSTAADLEHVLGVAPERISVVHNGVSRDWFRPEADKGEIDYLSSRWGVRPPYFMAASAHNWATKNLETALRALRLARTAAGVNFQTIVYGPSDGVAAAGGVARWPDLNLMCPGYVSRSDLAALFRHATAFIMPSLYEGFGLPALEAMSCGCPVVVSNCGSLPEIVGEAGQVFHPNDFEGMARALSDFLLNSSAAEFWRASALRRSMDFSWTKAASQTVAAYQAAGLGLNVRSPNREVLTSRVVGGSL
ncbi:MAG TPA: glycosyltransferase family 1 protein [Candidatus Angelobacter sp.]|nr:glycosyltransferase family 1 protein [Candidatus Angelobacter sp.]